MSNTRPPDFTKDEVRLITATLKERYGHTIETELRKSVMTIYSIASLAFSNRRPSMRRKN